MTSITRTAIKAIKFYKHIVQSVEKFIQKCRPEYKVPGLYVVDSIVRQSRHQFGIEKDVFGPRFMKNINLTFQQLFKCSEEDRCRIIRVLNLWQKNAVFPSNVVQPLMDMGMPGSSAEGTSKDNDPSQWKSWAQNDDGNSDAPVIAEMSTKNLEKFTKATNALEAEAEHATICREPLVLDSSKDAVKFDKKLLAFDYGDEDEEDDGKNDDGHLGDHPNALALSMAQQLLSNPQLLSMFQTKEILSQLQTQLPKIQQVMQQPEVVSQPEKQIAPAQNTADYHQFRNSPHQPPLPSDYGQPPIPMDVNMDSNRMLVQPPLPPKDSDERSLAAFMTPHMGSASLPTQQPGMRIDKDDRVLPDPSLPRDLDERSLAAILAPLERGIHVMPPGSIPQFPGQFPQPMLDPNGVPYPGQKMDNDERVLYNMPGEPPLPPKDFDERALSAPQTEERSSRRDRSRSRERSSRGSRRRSRSRSPRKKRSRSRSPHKSSRSSRKERVKEKEKEKEKEHDRQRKGIPPVKSGRVSVCSKTIWIGHVPKTCSENNIRDAFIPYGPILSVDMIPPRGCAYVVMEKRPDGHKALKNTRKFRLAGSVVKLAWAPGKGVKGKEWKEYWEEADGVSYVPVSKILGPETLDMLEEGAYIDEESLTDKLKAFRKKPDAPVFVLPGQLPNVTAASFPGMPNAAMVPQPAVMNPAAMMQSSVLLQHAMQPQFGLHLHGLLPPQAMMMQVPMGIPPPNQMLMVQQPSLPGQTLSLVGGVPSLVPRPVNPLTAALQNLKNIKLPDLQQSSPVVTPGTNAITPSTDLSKVVKSMSTQNTLTTPTSVSTPQTAFNAPNPPHSAVPSSGPAVSSANTSIPFPPPNSGYNFPPPNVRPGMPPNSQFSWMQNQRPPFGVPDNASKNPRLPASFSNKPAFSTNQTLKTDMPTDMDMDKLPNKDKMDESMDFPRNDGQRFNNSRDFPRMPMGMHHNMRGPPPPMQGGRFQNPNSPFPPRMQGGRGMGMHRQMEFDPPMFDPDMNPHQRNQQQPDGRRWYDRDYDAPGGMDRDGRFHDGRGREPWSSNGPDDSRRRNLEGDDFRKRNQDADDSRRRNQDGDDSRRRNQDGDDSRRRNQDGDDSRRRDQEGEDSRSRNQDGDDSRRRNQDGDDSRRRNQEDDFRRRNPEGDGDRFRNNDRWNGPERFDRPPHRVADDDDFLPKRRPPPKVRPTKDMAEDLFKLRFYQRDKKSVIQSSLTRQLEKKNKIVDELDVQIKKDIALEPKKHEEAPRKPEREARKRSRWGRSLSEEKEFSDQKRFEVELKFRGWEKSAQENMVSSTPAEEQVNSLIDSVPSELLKEVAAISDQNANEVPLTSLSTTEMLTEPPPQSLPKPTMKTQSMSVDDSFKYDPQLPSDDVGFQCDSELPSGFDFTSNSDMPSGGVSFEDNSEMSSAKISTKYDPELPSNDVSSKYEPEIPSADISSKYEPELSSNDVSSKYEPEIPSDDISSKYESELPSNDVSSKYEPELPSGDVSSKYEPELPSNDSLKYDPADPSGEMESNYIPEETHCEQSTEKSNYTPAEVFEPQVETPMDTSFDTDCGDMNSLPLTNDFKDSPTFADETLTDNADSKLAQNVSDTLNQNDLDSTITDS